MAWWHAAVYAVALVISFLTKPKAQDPKKLREKTIPRPKAEVGKPIPIVFGTRRIHSPNYVWWGDVALEQVFAQTQARSLQSAEGDQLETFGQALSPSIVPGLILYGGTTLDVAIAELEDIAAETDLPTEFTFALEAHTLLDNYADGASIDDAPGWVDRVSETIAVGQGTGANQPVLVENVASSGYPGVLFDGANDFLVNSTDPVQAQPYTVFIVAQRFGNTSTDYLTDGYAAANDLNIGYNGGNWLVSTGTVQNTSGAFQGRTLLTVEVNGATSNAWENRQQVLTNQDIGSESLAGIVLGALVTGGQAFDGVIQGLWIASGTHSERVRERLWSYIRKRVNLDSELDHSFTWIYDGVGTSGANPGDGFFRLNNLTLSSATELYINDLPLSEVSVASFMASLATDDYLFFESREVPNRSQVFQVSGVPTDNTDYTTVPVTFLAGAESFFDGESIQLTVVRGSKERGLDGMSFRFHNFNGAADPGSDYFRLNSATQGSSTNIYISTQSKLYSDMSEIFAKVEIGDVIETVSRTNEANFHLWSVSATPTDNTGWFTIPVTNLITGGDLDFDEYVYFRVHHQTVEKRLETMSFRFHNFTSANDPGNDYFRLNNATPASATAIYISTESTIYTDMTEILALVNNGALIELISAEDTANYQLYEVNGTPTDNTGWFTLPVVSREAGAAFTLDESVYVRIHNGPAADPDAIHDNVAGEIAAITQKVTPVAADHMLIEDSADSNNKKRITMGSIDHDALTNYVANEHIDWTVDTHGESIDAGVIRGFLKTHFLTLNKNYIARWNKDYNEDSLQQASAAINDANQMYDVAVASFIDLCAPYVATTTTIDWGRSASQWLLIQGNLTLAFTDPLPGARVMLRVVQDTTGSRTITWPSKVRWLGGSAPTLSTTAGDVDIITFFFDGFSYWGSAAGAAAADLVQEFVDRWDTHLFWAHDETSGTQADDSGPNADHGTYTSMTVNQNGLVAGDLKSVTGTSAYTRVTAITDNFSYQFTFMSLFNLSALNTLMDFNGTGGRGRVYNVAGTMQFYDSGNKSLGRQTAALQSADRLMGYSRKDAETIEVYEMGIKYKELTTDHLLAVTTPDVSHGATYTGTADASTGNYGLLAVFGEALSEDDWYLAFQKLWGKEHFWNEFIKTMQSNLVSYCDHYLPLWEEAGTQLIDISGVEDHATITGSLTLGVAPLDEYHMACVEGDGTADYITTNISTIIYNTANWTIAGVCVCDADGDGIFSVGSAGDSVGLRTAATSKLELYADDGTTELTLQVDLPAGAFGWCVRYYIENLDLFVDGVLVGRIDTTTLTMANVSTWYYMTDIDLGVANSLDGKFQHRGTYGSSLPNWICARLSAISPSKVFPPELFRNAYADGIWAVFEEEDIEAHFWMSDWDTLKSAGLVDIGPKFTNGDAITTSPLFGEPSLITNEEQLDYSQFFGFGNFSMKWGTGDYARLGTTRWNYIHQTAVFTVCGWVQWDVSVTGTILGSSTAAAHKGFRIDVSGSSFRAVFTDGTSTKTLTGTSTLVVGETYFFAVVGDGTNYTLYVNGIVEDTDTVLTVSGDATNNLTLGADHATSNELDGWLDEMTFLRIAATQAQLQDYYFRCVSSLA